MEWTMKTDPSGLQTRWSDELARRYPRWDDFLELRLRLDPDGRFLNTFLRRHLTG